MPNLFNPLEVRCLLSEMSTVHNTEISTAWCSPFVKLTFRNIQVEEVTVEYCLHTASHHSNQVKEALEVVTVDPIQDVQGSVRS